MHIVILLKTASVKTDIAKMLDKDSEAEFELQVLQVSKSAI